MHVIRSCLLLVALAVLLAGEEPDPGAVAMQQIEAVHDEIKIILDLAAQPKLEAARRACLALEARTLQPDATSDLMYILVQVPYNAGCYSALLGRSDEAFTALERAIALGYDDAGHIAEDSDLTSLRGDTRFAALLAHARQRAAAGSVSGTLCEPSIRTVFFTGSAQGDAAAKATDRLAVRIPASKELRERVVWLACTPAQEAQLVDLMERGRIVRISGSGGTYMSRFRLSVTGFNAVEP